MALRVSLSVATIVVFLGATVPLWAEGKGGGLHRALSATGKGQSHSGLSRASDHVSRSGKGFEKSGSSLGRSNQGLQRASSSINRSVETPDLEKAKGANPSSTNPQRIADRRMEKADDLRDIAEKNGNERLDATADRMSDRAARNFERQTGAPYQPPTSGVPTDSSATSPTTTPPVLPASGIESSKPAPKAGWRNWFLPR